MKKVLTNAIVKLIKEDPDILDWNILCSKYTIPYSIIKKNVSRMSIRIILSYQELPDEFIEKYIHRKDLISIICANQILSTRIMLKYIDILDWKTMSFYQDIPEPLVRKVIDKVCIEEIIVRQKVSSEFITEFSYMIDWNYMESIYCKNKAL